MSDPLVPPQITADDLAAARALFAGKLADCPFCLGFSPPDARRAPARWDPVICLSDARDSWYVRCFSCWCCATSTISASHAVQRWNTRPPAGARQQDLLPLVDVRKAAERAGLELTPQAEAFARQLQADVLRLNRRPL